MNWNDWGKLLVNICHIASWIAITVLFILFALDLLDLIDVINSSIDCSIKIDIK